MKNIIKDINEQPNKGLEVSWDKSFRPSAGCRHVDILTILEAHV